MGFWLYLNNKKFRLSVSIWSVLSVAYIKVLISKKIKENEINKFHDI